jgi:FeS assembly SUF system protein
MFSFFKRSDPYDLPPDRGADPSPPDDREDDPFNMSALVEPPAAVPASEPVPQVEADPLATLELKPKVVEAITSVFDPEIPVNIYELGLVYDILIGADRRVLVKMTLTSPNCPSAQSLPGEVRFKVKAVPGVTDAHVEIVWEPPWTMEKMSDTARLQLGLL